MDSESKADGFNISERMGRCLGAPQGRIPIRKKGYHRALKRGEVWAILKKQTDHVTRQLLMSLYEEPKKENPFLKMIGLSEMLHKPIPIVFK